MQNQTPLPNKPEVLNSTEKFKMDQIPMTFPEAMKRVVDGEKVTRIEWDDPRHYGTLNKGILCLHKAGEAGDVFYSWIINDGDMTAQDWLTVLTDIN